MIPNPSSSTQGARIGLVASCSFLVIGSGIAGLAAGDPRAAAVCLGLISLGIVIAVVVLAQYPAIFGRRYGWREFSVSAVLASIAAGLGVAALVLGAGGFPESAGILALGGLALALVAAALALRAVLTR
jgi:hypothetical protein